MVVYFSGHYFVNLYVFEPLKVASGDLLGIHYVPYMYYFDMVMDNVTNYYKVNGTE